MNNTKGLLTFACISGMIAVILGAFGAHAMKTVLQTDQLESYRTAVLYQFVHTLVMLAALIIFLFTKLKGFRTASIFFAIGILLFSGSIYLLSTQSITGIKLSFLGPVTPIGGVLFVIGWLMMIIETRKL